MRCLGKSQNEILKGIISSMKDNYLKIENSKGFMPVVVEVIGALKDSPGSGRLISLAHYYEQNGDLMRDPEMVFLESIDQMGNVAYFPISYQQDGLQLYREAVLIEDGKITSINQKMQNSFVNFANLWIKNIKMQQGL